MGACAHTHTHTVLITLSLPTSLQLLPSPVSHSLVGRTILQQWKHQLQYGLRLTAPRSENGRSDTHLPLFTELCTWYAVCLLLGYTCKQNVQNKTIKQLLFKHLEYNCKKSNIKLEEKIAVLQHIKVSIISARDSVAQLTVEPWFFITV